MANEFVAALLLMRLNKSVALIPRTVLGHQYIGEQLHFSVTQVPSPLTGEFQQFPAISLALGRWIDSNAVDPEMIRFVGQC